MLVSVVGESGIANAPSFATGDAPLTIARLNAAGRNVPLESDVTQFEAGDRLELENRAGRLSLVELREVMLDVDREISETSRTPLTIRRTTWLTATLEGDPDLDVVVELRDSQDNVIATGDDPEEIAVPRLQPGTYALVARLYGSEELTKFTRPLRLRALTAEVP
jgi:hypothetical protein